jgi:hypothetical protein
MTHLFSRFRIRALGVVARLLAAPTPYMLTGPGSSLELARLIADRGSKSVLVVTKYMSAADCLTIVRRAAGTSPGKKDI